MSERIVYCKICKSAYSTEKYPAVFCPKCNIPLFETNLPAGEWRQKTSIEKDELKNTWNQKTMKSVPLEQNYNATAPSDPVVMNNGISDFYSKQIADSLKQIAESTQKTSKWIEFWGVLTLIGYGLIILLAAFSF